MIVVDDFQHAWVAALEALELDVAAAEALLRADHVDPTPVLAPPSPVTGAMSPPPPAAAGWQPPAGLGPLPPQLRERAQAVLRRQTLVAEQLVRHIATNRQQAAFAARLETGRSAHRPAYVDRAL
ncbi:hypothetical protein ACFQX7_06665 [Luedemannella flava]